MDWSLSSSDKRTLIYVKKVGNIPTEISRRTISSTDKKVGFRTLSFALDINKPLFRVKNNFFYIIDIDEGQ